MCNDDSFLGLLAEATPIESKWIHFGAAIVLFVMMAALCMMQFTRSSKSDRIWPRKSEVSAGKWRRNIAFIACGAVILASILAVATVKLFVGEGGYSLLIAETVMVWAFGFAWQLKGEVGRNVKAKWVAWAWKPYQKWYWGHA